MNPVEELRLHVKALDVAVEQNKCFVPIIHYVKRLKELLTTSSYEATQSELKFLVGEIEEFYTQCQYPIGKGWSYIPPEISDTDSTVAKISRTVAELAELPEEEFYSLSQAKPGLNLSAEQQPSSKGKTPCVFIGHGRSKLWARVKIFLEDELGLETVAYESEPRTGESIVPILEQMLDQATFAILVFTAEDDTTDGTKRARQNVVHEAGLFQGRLSFKKTVLLFQKGLEPFSNVDGLQHIPFDDESVEQTFYELEKVLKREGLIQK